MIVALIGKNKMLKTNLPKFTIGNYAINDENGRKIINIESKNGNWQIAVKEMNKVDDLKSIAETADPSSVLKAPWNYYGKVLTFTGTVSDIKENPPDSESSKRLGGSSYSVVVNLENDVTVQGEMAGSSGNIKEGQQLTIYGYPVGTIEGNNTMGGHPVYICIV